MVWWFSPQFCLPIWQPDFLGRLVGNFKKPTFAGWWQLNFFSEFSPLPPWGNEPIWRAYFSNVTCNHQLCFIFSVRKRNNYTLIYSPEKNKHWEPKNHPFLKRKIIWSIHPPFWGSKSLIFPGGLGFGFLGWFFCYGISQANPSGSCTLKVSLAEGWFSWAVTKALPWRFGSRVFCSSGLCLVMSKWAMNDNFPY